MNENGLIIHTDGGARGNPGPAACAFIAEKNGNVVHKESKFLGPMTNNQAEYQGLILALRWLSKFIIANHAPVVTVHMDSELIVKQLSGAYRVKDEELRGLFFEVGSSIKKIQPKIIFKNVPRSKNKLADFLVNQELDKNFKLRSVMVQ